MEAKKTNGRSKYTDEQIADLKPQMYSLRELGLSWKQVAEQMKIPQHILLYWVSKDRTAPKKYNTAKHRAAEATAKTTKPAPTLITIQKEESSPVVFQYFKGTQEQLALLSKIFGG